LWCAIFSLLLVEDKPRPTHFQQFEPIFLLARIKKEGTIDFMEILGTNWTSMDLIGKSIRPVLSLLANPGFQPADSLLALIPSATDFAPRSRFGTTLANAAGAVLGF
jgi:hypothetical protein